MGFWKESTHSLSAARRADDGNGVGSVGASLSTVAVGTALRIVRIRCRSESCEKRRECEVEVIPIEASSGTELTGRNSLTNGCELSLKINLPTVLVWCDAGQLVADQSVPQRRPVPSCGVSGIAHVSVFLFCCRPEFGCCRCLGTPARGASLLYPQLGGVDV